MMCPLELGLTRLGLPLVSLAASLRYTFYLNYFTGASTANIYQNSGSFNGCGGNGAGGVAR